MLLAAGSKSCDIVAIMTAGTIKVVAAIAVVVVVVW